MKNYTEKDRNTHNERLEDEYLIQKGDNWQYF